MSGLDKLPEKLKENVKKIAELPLEDIFNGASFKICSKASFYIDMDSLDVEVYVDGDSGHIVLFTYENVIFYLEYESDDYIFGIIIEDGDTCYTKVGICNPGVYGLSGAPRMSPRDKKIWNKVKGKIKHLEELVLDCAGEVYWALNEHIWVLMSRVLEILKEEI